jgi:membrane protein DedA with SNARE-associated domain
MEHFLATYGAIGVFLGAAFEGQTAVIVGGLLARQHLMNVWVVFASAAAGSAIIDHLLFVAGRRYRSSRIVVRAAGQPAFAKALRFIERYPVGYILVFRFIFGLRLASPIAVGVSQVPTWSFTILNAIAAAIWSGVFVGAGYVGAEALHAMFHGHHAGRITIAVAVAFIAVVAIAGLMRWLAHKRQALREAEA